MTPPRLGELLLAIAEEEDLDRTAKRFGLSPKVVQQLLRNGARALNSGISGSSAASRRSKDKEAVTEELPWSRRLDGGVDDLDVLDDDVDEIDELAGLAPARSVAASRSTSAPRPASGAASDSTAVSKSSSRPTSSASTSAAVAREPEDDLFTSQKKPASAGKAPASVLIYSDGAARGNPGPAGAGAVLMAPDGTVLVRKGKFLGRQTNNVAEYEGVLLGLRTALELGVREVDVRADSMLLVKQIKGEWKVKNAGLRPLVSAARELLGKFDRYSLIHVPREMNAEADEMSNRAIDERM